MGITDKRNDPPSANKPFIPSIVTAKRHWCRRALVAVSLLPREGRDGRKEGSESASTLPRPWRPFMKCMFLQGDHGGQQLSFAGSWIVVAQQGSTVSSVHIFLHVLPSAQSG